MSPISITVSDIGNAHHSNPWTKLGLTKNPFPPSGVAEDVDYEAHQPEVERKINQWLSRSLDKNAAQWAPLAISGSIGVGKTHVLRRIERACIEFRNSSGLGHRVMVSSHTLTNAGMKNLQLGSLLRESLGQSVPDIGSRPSSSALPFVDVCVDQLFVTKQIENIDSILPSPSPLLAPLKRIAAEKTGFGRATATSLLAAWIGQRNLTSVQMERIGVQGKLETEGQLIRVFAHLCLLAQKAFDLRAWVLMLDQLEDLWRRDLTSPLRRTRFLTDLRTLIDEGMEGAPIAIVLAWNTEVALTTGRAQESVESRLRHDYLALFSRVQDVVKIPPLPQTHALPFALAYVEVEQRRFEIESKLSHATIAQMQEKFTRALRESADSILAEVANHGETPDRALIARGWLDALRAWADRYITTST